jgi:hypothetical protein
VKRADNIGLYEVFRAMYRPVDMTLRGKVNDGSGASFSKQLPDANAVADIGSHQLVRSIFP